VNFALFCGYLSALIITVGECENLSITPSLAIPKNKTPKIVNIKTNVIAAGIRGGSQSVVRSRKNITTIRRK
jgi:hypothetical protein